MARGRAGGHIRQQAGGSGSRQLAACQQLPQAGTYPALRAGSPTWGWEAPHQPTSGPCPPPHTPTCARLSGAVEQDALLLQAHPRGTQRGQHARQADAGSALDVVVEAAEGGAVALQQVEGRVVGKVLQGGGGDEEGGRGFGRQEEGRK